MLSGVFPGINHLAFLQIADGAHKLLARGVCKIEGIAFDHRVDDQAARAVDDIGIAGLPEPQRQDAVPEIGEVDQFGKFIPVR